MKFRSISLNRPFYEEAKVCFPITGGAIDLGEEGKAEITHSAGLALIQEGTNGDEATETIVELTTFIIDITGENPVLTGLVIVNGSLLGRVPLFDLDLEKAEVRQKYKKLSVRNVVLTLTEVAAEALNGVFFGGEAVLGVDTKIGVAKVFAYLYRGYYDGCEL